MGKLKRTIKEQEFIKAYIDCKGNATKAYSQVFPNVKKESARVLGCNLLAKINLPITELMEMMGIDDHVINTKLNQGLNATTTKKVGKGKDEKTITVPLYYVQAKYLDMILRVKAKYPIDETRLKLPGTGDGGSITLRELIYNKDPKPDNKEDKLSIKRDKVKVILPETVDTPPF